MKDDDAFTSEAEDKNDSPPFSCRMGNACRQRLCQWLRRAVGNLDEAEDICQEICLHCLTGQAVFRGESQFTTWLHRIMVNAYRYYLRKKRRREEILTTEVSEEALHSAQTAQEWTEAAQAERFSLTERVRIALSHLNLRQRQLLEWKYVEGYSLAEIAQRLGIKEESARQALYRAREAFKRTYRQIGKQPRTYQ